MNLDPRDHASRRSVRLLLWALLAGLLAVQISPLWYPTPDARSYLSMARSVANDGLPRNLGSRQLWYPPGYAYLISPAFWIDEQPFLVLSVMHWVIALLLAWGVFRWSKRIVPESPLIVTALTMVNVTLWLYYRRTLTELAFMTGLIWTAEVVSRLLGRLVTPAPNRLLASPELPTVDAPSAIPRSSAVNDSNRGTKRPTGEMRLWALALTCGVLIAGLSLIRQAGITLAGGFGLCVLWHALHGRIRWRRSIAAAGCVVLPAVASILALMMYESHTATQIDGRTYLSNLAGSSQGIWAAVLEGIRWRISEMGQLTLPGMFKADGNNGQWFNFNTLVYVAWFVLLIKGWGRLVRRGVDPLVLCVPAYLVLYLAYPLASGGRFLLPLLPLLFAALWCGLPESWSLRTRQHLSVVMVAMHLAVSVGYWRSVDLPRARASAAQWPLVERWSRRIDSRPGTVSAEGLPQSLHSMFELRLDQRLLGQSPPAEWGQAPQAATSKVRSHPTAELPGESCEVQWMIVPVADSRQLATRHGLTTFESSDDWALLGPRKDRQGQRLGRAMPDGNIKRHRGQLQDF